MSLPHLACILQQSSRLLTVLPESDSIKSEPNAIIELLVIGQTSFFSEVGEGGTCMQERGTEKAHTHIQEGGGVDQMFWRHIPASIHSMCIYELKCDFYTWRHTTVICT